MEILIWGDDMRRQISISFLCAIILIVLMWLYIKFYNENKLTENEFTTEINYESKEDAQKVSIEDITYQFFIRDENGRVVVYTTKEQEVYMETGIETIALPSYLQERITSGIFFKNEKELYDFLESYSS